MARVAAASLDIRPRRRIGRAGGLTWKMGGVTGFEPAKATRPGHYSRLPSGLKCASLLGPHWLVRCIRKDPSRYLNGCPGITRAGVPIFSRWACRSRPTPPLHQILDSRFLVREAGFDPAISCFQG